MPDPKNREQRMLATLKPIEIKTAADSNPKMHGRQFLILLFSRHAQVWIRNFQAEFVAVPEFLRIACS
jgi:hypothetical protein